MTMSSALSAKGQSTATRAFAHDVELEEQLCDTFVKMRNLLEQYAPSWYTEAVHESSEADCATLVQMTHHSRYIPNGEGGVLHEDYYALKLKGNGQMTTAANTRIVKAHTAKSQTEFQQKSKPLAPSQQAFPMSCKSCQAEKRRVFNGEVAIHFPGLRGLNMPIVWVFPKLNVCLDCGFAEFEIPERELRVLEDGEPSVA